LISPKLLAKVVSINILLGNSDLTEKFQVLVKKLTILFMKVNLKMIYTMDMEDSFIQMVTIILETGLMERDLDTENL
jgi:hypothetical protein